MNYYIDVLRKYAVFNGRARRKEYWMFNLFNAIVYLIFFILGAISSGTFDSNLSLDVFSFLEAIYVLALFIPSIAVTFRRLHDTGRSGWWFLISFVPFVGGIILLVFLVLDSQPGANQYGPNPKETVLQ